MFFVIFVSKALPSILFAIHDFLPRHRAGSEIYAAALAAELAKTHHVTVLCAEYDPARRHGEVTWRVYDGVPVVEVVNNWIGQSFEDSYRPALINERIGQVLDAVQPDVVHVHNLLNLSLDLPAMARARGIPVVATLHDYTLVCPSGGQRVHLAESHLCETIDTARCARCFRESPFYAQLSVGAIASAAPGGLVQRVAGLARRAFPVLVSRAATAARRLPMVEVTPPLMDARLVRAKQTFEDIDEFVAPSKSIAEEFVRLGVDATRLEVSGYGHTPVQAAEVRRPRTPLRIGFLGTIAWHKGVHVIIDAVKDLPPSAVELRIFGSTAVAPDYVATLRQRATGLPVRFEGPFDSGQVADVCASIDVMVVPSLWPENAPLVIQEASLAGVPVIGARMGGIPEFVREGENGWLFDPRRPVELTTILRDLVRRPDEVARRAASSPPIRTMQDDARAWEGRYRRVIARRQMCAS